ncbi:MAG: 50S ribosomal protein L11 methyltransferase [Thermoanaerobaculia bacterium]
MTDHVLEIVWAASRTDLGERIEAELYLFSPGGWAMEEEGPMMVARAWFAGAEERSRVADALGAIEGVAVDAIERRTIDWLEHYQQSLHALTIGTRWIVAPDAALVGESDRIPLIVPQERAFGTGSHESTALCLEMLEELPLEGREGLDIGTGSGILAIAMVKLGARHVVAFDNDTETIDIVGPNLARNGIPGDHIGFFVGAPESIRAREFALVTMNILPEVIVPLLPQVRSFLGPDGNLIVSGILHSRREDILSAASAEALTLASESTRGEWWCGLLRNDEARLAVPPER